MLHTKNGTWLGLGVTFLFNLLSPFIRDSSADIVSLIPEVVNPQLNVREKEPQCYTANAPL